MQTYRELFRRDNHEDTEEHEEKKKLKLRRKSPYALSLTWVRDKALSHGKFVLHLLIISH